MIKHNCQGSPDGRFPARVLYFADPGELFIEQTGAIIYERTSTAIGMVCPQCGLTVPYQIVTVTEAPVVNGGTVTAPEFETL